MERLKYGEAKMKYPKQWIVMVNMEDVVTPNVRGGKMYTAYGDVHMVTPSEKEAYAEAKRIGDTMGENMVIEGFNDTPMIGGLYINEY